MVAWILMEMGSIFSQMIKKEDYKPPLTITNKKEFQSLGKCSESKRKAKQNLRVTFILPSILRNS